MSGSQFTTIQTKHQATMQRTVLLFCGICILRPILSFIPCTHIRSKGVELVTRQPPSPHCGGTTHPTRQTLEQFSSTGIVSKTSDRRLLPASIAVGSITAFTGFLYGKALSFSQNGIWNRLGSNFASPYFIIAMCTLGGLLVGTLSSFMKSEFTVGDFVTSFSSSTVGTVPNSTSHLLPLLVTSLITSAFGFSLGPEAPMVCAGVLVGNTLAKKWNQNPTILSYAGAAGTLTASMGIPIAGSIFALEMTRSSTNMVSSSKALPSSIAASIAALFLLRGVLTPGAMMGGHFDYGIMGAITGREAMGVALLGSVMGATVGTLFHKTVVVLKRILWGTKGTYSRRRKILTKAGVGLLVGLLSTQFPQTMFWGEGSLQTVIDGQQTAFSATKHGLSTAMTRLALVDPSIPWSAMGAAKVGLAKFVAIALASAGKFPGGIIFPLFFASAPFAHVVAPLIAPSMLPILVICTMAATQASATRTPLATALILSLMATPSTELSVMLPACLVASYGGVYVSELLSSKSYFQYSR